jgi:hypothetical protein
MPTSCTAVWVWSKEAPEWTVVHIDAFFRGQDPGCGPFTEPGLACGSIGPGGKLTPCSNSGVTVRARLDFRDALRRWREGIKQIRSSEIPFQTRSVRPSPPGTYACLFEPSRCIDTGNLDPTEETEPGRTVSAQQINVVLHIEILNVIEPLILPASLTEICSRSVLRTDNYSKMLTLHPARGLQDIHLVLQLRRVQPTTNRNLTLRPQRYCCFACRYRQSL